MCSSLSHHWLNAVLLFSSSRNSLDSGSMTQTLMLLSCNHLIVHPTTTSSLKSSDRFPRTDSGKHLAKAWLGMLSCLYQRSNVLWLTSRFQCAMCPLQLWVDAEPTQKGSPSRRRLNKVHYERGLADLELCVELTDCVVWKHDLQPRKPLTYQRSGAGTPDCPARAAALHSSSLSASPGPFQPCSVAGFPAQQPLR